VQTLKAIACFDYQACETDDWQQSEAFAFCEALRDRAINKLPGYSEAKWGIDEPDPRPSHTAANQG